MIRSMIFHASFVVAYYKLSYIHYLWASHRWHVLSQNQFLIRISGAIKQTNGFWHLREQTNWNFIY